MLGSIVINCGIMPYIYLRQQLAEIRENDRSLENTKAYGIIRYHIIDRPGNTQNFVWRYVVYILIGCLLVSGGLVVKASVFTPVLLFASFAFYRELGAALTPSSPRGLSSQGFCLLAHAERGYGRQAWCHTIDDDD